MIKRLTSVGGYVILSVWVIFSLFPLYFMVVSATNTSQDVLASKLLPGGELFDNFAKLIDLQNLGAAMSNSFLIAIGTTVLALAVSAVAGYGFEVFHSKGKDVLMGVLLLALMIPFAATMIPLFQVFAKIGLVNSLFAVIIPSIATPLLILLFRQASRSFPRELLEAARVDGVNELAIFARIYVPTMRATFAAAGVITFLAVVEQLPVAPGHPHQERGADHADAHREPQRWLRHGLRRAHARGAPRLAADGRRVLPAAASVRERCHGGHQVTFDLDRVADPRFVAENRLPAHSDHRWFRDQAEADAGQSGYEQLLSGVWKFHYAPSPADTVAGFEAADFDADAWDDIPVPAHIQLEGYDRPQYVNVQYPWDGQEQVEPGEIPTLFNPVASYVRSFTLEHPLEPGETVSVVFEGAESAIAVWCNGTTSGTRPTASRRRSSTSPMRSFRGRTGSPLR